jgi:hypothetical protein
MSVIPEVRRVMRRSLPARSLLVRALGPPALLVSLVGATREETGDAGAERLMMQAMEGAYFATKFDAAETKLRRAVIICEKKGCSPAVHAKIYGYLGVVHGPGQNDYDTATADLTSMLLLDPKQPLDDQYANDELREALVAAKEAARKAIIEERKAAVVRAREEARKADEARQAEEEHVRQAEEARRAAEERKAEAARKLEEARAAAVERKEAARRLAEERKQEALRKVEEARQAEEEKRLRTPPPLGTLEEKPWKEQAAGYPVPVFVKLPPPPPRIEPQRVEVVRVVMEYSSPALPLPRQVDLTPMQGGYGVLIPCDASQQQGELRYFTTAYNKYDIPVARGGSMEKPNRLQIKVAISTAQPHLPGDLPPKSCTDPDPGRAKAKSCPPGTDCAAPTGSCGPDCETPAAIVPAPAPPKLKPHGGGCAGCEVGTSSPIPRPASWIGLLMAGLAAARRYRTGGRLPVIDAKPPRPGERGPVLPPVTR